MKSIIFAETLLIDCRLLGFPADGGDQKGLALPIMIAREAMTHLSHNGLLILYTGVPISINGTDPLHTTLHRDRFFTEKSEVLNYEVLGALAIKSCIYAAFR